MGLPKQQDEHSNLKLLHSKAFENNTLIFMLTSYATEENHYKPLMKDLDVIIRLIDQEIK